MWFRLREKGRILSYVYHWRNDAACLVHVNSIYIQKIVGIGIENNGRFDPEGDLVS